MSLKQSPIEYIRLDDGRLIPFMGEANTDSLEEWNRKCEAQAIKNFTEDHGYQPERAEQALTYQKQKYGTPDQMQESEKQDIPVRRGKIKVIYCQ